MYEEQTLEDLKWENRKLKEKVRTLEEELRKKDLELDHLQFRIENELEPRIRQERRLYDSWVSDPERR